MMGISYYYTIKNTEYIILDACNYAVWGASTETIIIIIISKMGWEYLYNTWIHYRIFSSVDHFRSIFSTFVADIRICFKRKAFVINITIIINDLSAWRSSEKYWRVWSMTVCRRANWTTKSWEKRGSCARPWSSESLKIPRQSAPNRHR